jgi:putative SOS response-associated peptidase YedK
MCGRFGLSSEWDILTDRFNFTGRNLVYRPRYNIAPTQEVLTVIREDTGSAARFMKWGLIPNWAKNPSVGNRMINARAETVTTKPAFRVALRKRRCLILADGFYEWKKTPIGKTPMRIVLKSG